MLLENKTHPSNHTPRPHRAPPPNPHPRQNHHIRRNPHVILNHHRLPILRPAVARPPPRIGAARPRVNTHIRADNDIAPDPDLADVVDQAVSANRDIVPNLNVVPVVAVEGRLDSRVVAHPTRVRDGGHESGRKVHAFARMENVSEQAGALGWGDANVGVGRVVEAPAGRVAALALEDELLVKGVVLSAVEHLFLFATGTVRGKLRVG